MSVELLRRAARQMREQADAATPSPWLVDGAAIYTEERSRIVAYSGTDNLSIDRANGRHIASWHPAVALAVADWLEAAADAWEDTRRDGYEFEVPPPSVAVARAYLDGAS